MGEEQGGAPVTSWKEQQKAKKKLLSVKSRPQVRRAPDYSLLPEKKKTDPVAVDLEENFVFDEDVSFHRSLSDIPVVISRSSQRERIPSINHADMNRDTVRVEKQPCKSRHMTSNKKMDSHKARHQEFSGRAAPYLCVGVISVCAFCLAFIVVMMMPQISGFFWRDLGNYAFVNGEILRYNPEMVATYKQQKNYMNQPVIYQGIFVDGIHVGGLTIEQAREKLEENQGQLSPQASAFSLTVAIGNKTWLFDSSNIPTKRDIGNVLEKAYAIGRTNTSDIIGTMLTPFKQRTQTALALMETGINLPVGVTYDHRAVQTHVEEIVEYVSREPIDAQIHSFDFAHRTFSFTEGQAGVAIDGEALYNQIISNLDKGEKGAVLTVEPLITQPTITKQQLQSQFTMVAAYTTNTTNDTNRNSNIDLACRSINGTVLMPGETFSFNQTTGQRTLDKGYREAGAISGGQTIDEVGGGICQVSSTLFNAVARADLEIVSRTPHAWPSSYVNSGEDATVNWPNLDFTFKNNRTTPIFVITYYQDRKTSAEIWGVTLGEGISIELASEVVQTNRPSSEAIYVYNANLPYGTTKETVKARKGYVVDTYKVWYKNGNEIKREKMHTSTYRTYQQTIEYNQ